MQRSTTWKLAALTVAVFTGCQPGTTVQRSDAESSGSPAVLIAPDQMDEAQQRQQLVALAARDTLFQQLSGRLTEVLTDAGPTKAIEVCKSDAPRLAGEVGQQFGVSIGRTSHRLRNPANKPPDWSQALVDQQVAEPQFVSLDDGRLGVLLPIHLKAACVLCHGPKDKIVPDVRASLVSHYPQDQATGFQEGDLRGWFWVEVPAGATLPNDPNHGTRVQRNSPNPAA
jgi:hypothetical protein